MNMNINGHPAKPGDELGTRSLPEKLAGFMGDEIGKLMNAASLEVTWDEMNDPGPDPGWLELLNRVGAEEVENPMTDLAHALAAYNSYHNPEHGDPPPGVGI